MTPCGSGMSAGWTIFMTLSLKGLLLTALCVVCPLELFDAALLHAHMLHPLVVLLLVHDRNDRRHLSI